MAEKQASIQEQLSVDANGLKLRCVAVDLTPMLAGGENGGAKIFVLELLRYLAEIAPNTRFLLLTNAASHEELEFLDRPNIQRHLMLGNLNTATPNTPTNLSQFKAVVSRLAPKIPVRLIKLASRVGYKLATALKRRASTSTLLRELSVDLLFCPFTAPTYFEPGIPVVCTIYDLQYKMYPDFFSPADVAQRHETFLDACRRATALAAISDYSRDSAISHGRLQPEFIRTIHLRIAHRFATQYEPATQTLDRFDLSTGRYLLYPANFWMHKNHEMLFTAFGMARSNGLIGKDIKLVCTGAPSSRQQWLSTAANSMGLGHQVLFPGYLPNRELSQLLSNSGGVIFPSLYEGFGLPILEAMAAGVPVASSNAASLPEIASDAAILFDPRVPAQIAEAMASLINDGQLRSRLIAAGRQRVIEFSDPSLMARQYWELFQYAIAKKRTS